MARGGARPGSGRKHKPESTKRKGEYVIKMTPDERRQIIDNAERAGLPVATYLRTKGLTNGV